MVLASGVRKRRVLYLVLGLSCIAVILGVITALSVRARAPRPVVSPEPSAAFTPTAPPGRAVSIAVSPQENVEPGELIVLTGQGWGVGDEISVDLVAPSGETRFVATATVAPDGSFLVPFFYPLEAPWIRVASVSIRASAGSGGDQLSAVILIAEVGETVVPGGTASPVSTPILQPTATISPVWSPTFGPTEAPLPTSNATPSATAPPRGEETVTATRTPHPWPTPTPTAVPFTWRGEYFSNRFLTGSPTIVRNDTGLDFLWGTGAPATGMPADGFSARWTRTASFQSGTYRFFASSDDGVRIWVDGVPLINRWSDGASDSYSADRWLGAGNHSLRVEYYENTGLAQLQVWWERLGEFPQWRGEYFSGPNLVGAPVVIRNDADIDFDWGAYSAVAGLPADGFSARWTRDAWFEDGLYRFRAVVDDGLRLTIDDVPVIDAWRDGARREVTADYALLSGSHRVRVEYYERSGQALVQLAWERVAAYPDWKGEYWSNRSLAGSPALVRTDAVIDFNWGWASPAPTLPSTDFSARWTRTAGFDAATYRFHVLVDDGARLWVDDALLIDSWRDGAAREVTEDLTLARGDHEIVVTYYEHGGEARIRVWWEKVDTRISDWKGEYWSNRTLDGKPGLVRNDAEIDFDWGRGRIAVGLPEDNFSARWRRDVDLRPGVYRFEARADDGIRVYLDGKPIIDEWHGSDGDEVYRVDKSLSGEHDLRVDYYEREGTARVSLSWERISALPTATPTPTPSVTPSATSTDTPSPTPTPTPSSTPTPTPTTSPVATSTSTPSPTPTLTAEPTATHTPEPTATTTPDEPAGETPTPSVTPTPTTTPTATATPTPTPTFTPTFMPTPTDPSKTVRVNEIMPFPAQDGIFDEFEEWIELYNAGDGDVDLSGWLLDDAVGDSEGYRISEGTVLVAGSFALFHGRTTGIVLDDLGDQVRLLAADGKVVDVVDYGQLAPNASWCRDEAGIWHNDWPPSPGAPNQPSVVTPTSGSILFRF